MVALGGREVTPLRLTRQQLVRWESPNPEATRPQPYLKKTPPPPVGEGFARKGEEPR